MTELMEKALRAVREMPPDVQDDLARVLLELTGKDQPLIELTADEAAALDESLAQADRGEFATDQEIRAIWAKYGL
jgi:hypothetical protein